MLSSLWIRPSSSLGGVAPGGQPGFSLPGVQFSVQSGAPSGLGLPEPGGPQPQAGRGEGLRAVPVKAAGSRSRRSAPKVEEADNPAPAGGESEEAPNISPTDFARDVLGVDLWEKQKEVLSALPEHRRVAVKSGNGLGKGFSAAVAVLWFLHTHRPAIVLSTAPTFRQVRHILWRQIHVLHRQAPDVLKGKLLDTRWELAEDRYAMGLSADSADQFQGFHSPHMLIVVDEAEGVSDAIYEAIDSVMTSDGSRLLLIGNPTTVTGVFRRAFHEERSIYHCITISALESPNVRDRQVSVPGLTTAEWVDERKEIWGENNVLYRARVLGEFPDHSEDTLIRLSDVEAAVERWKALPAPGNGRALVALPEPAHSAHLTQPGATDTRPAGNSALPALVEGHGERRIAPRDPASLPAVPNLAVRGDGEVVLSVDVARYGSDQSVILRRRGSHIEEIQTFNGMDTMELAGWVAAAIREFQPAQTCIDEVGVGAGVVDRLREQGYGVRGVNAAHSARQKGVFANIRAEGYWKLRDLFAAGAIAIPEDQRLLGELAALRYSFDSQGRLLMESKEDMRKRGSPRPTGPMP